MQLAYAPTPPGLKNKSRKYIGPSSTTPLSYTLNFKVSHLAGHGCDRTNLYSGTFREPSGCDASYLLAGRTSTRTQSPVSTSCCASLGDVLSKPC